MIYEKFNHLHLKENANTIMIVKVIFTDIWDRFECSGKLKNIYIYIISVSTKILYSQKSNRSQTK